MTTIGLINYQNFIKIYSRHRNNYFFIIAQSRSIFENCQNLSADEPAPARIFVGTDSNFTLTYKQIYIKPVK